MLRYTLIFFFFALNASAAPLKLALNWKPEPQFGGFYAAQVNGDYKKQGLDVEILEGGSGTPTVQMLANSKVDFAVVSAEEIVISNERNPKNPVLALFAVYQTNPQMIMCHEAQPAKTLADVFAQPGTLSWQSGLTYAQYLLKKYPQAKVRTVPYLGGLSTFLADKTLCQQGFITSEPLSAEKAGVKVRTYLIADEGFNPYTTVLAVRSATLKKSPDQVKKMVEAVRAGWTAYLASPAETNKKMQSLNAAMDADTFAKSAAKQVDLIQNTDTKKNGLGTMTDARWLDLARQLRDLKVIKSTPTADSLFQAL